MMMMIRPIIMIIAKAFVLLATAVTNHGEMSSPFSMQIEGIIVALEIEMQELDLLPTYS
jgi:hypothetical protein